MTDYPFLGELSLLEYVIVHVMCLLAAIHDKNKKWIMININKSLLKCQTNEQTLLILTFNRKLIFLQI